MVFGLEESYKESKWDLCYSLVDLFCNELHISMNENAIDDCYRMGKHYRIRPVLVSFVSTLMRDNILERSKFLLMKYLSSDRGFLPFFKSTHSMQKTSRENKHISYIYIYIYSIYVYIYIYIYIYA